MLGLSEGLAQTSVISGKRKTGTMGQKVKKETFSGIRILPEELINSPRNPEKSGEFPKHRNRTNGYKVRCTLKHPTCIATNVTEDLKLNQIPDKMMVRPPPIRLSAIAIAPLVVFELVNCLHNKLWLQETQHGLRE